MFELAHYIGLHGSGLALSGKPLSSVRRAAALRYHADEHLHPMSGAGDQVSAAARAVLSSIHAAAVTGMAMPAILVVEDDPLIREALGEFLSEEGYTVRTAEHGQQGLEHLRTGFVPRLILLDLMMPVMDGRQFLTHLRSEGRYDHIPVVVLTAASDVRRLQGVVRVLNKPVDIKMLLQVVRDQCAAAAANSP